MVKTTEFLDPEVYAKDKEITVAGVIAGDIERTVGKRVIKYRYYLQRQFTFSQPIPIIMTTGVMVLIPILAILATIHFSEEGFMDLIIAGELQYYLP
ncbi:Slp family lipoprotein [uncultured Nitrosomonas sp.]|uniref:Slp family lipoprotein n=1 Tax=uncultured Nitrosomonas sp. TaxID=156424 RepID=UPI0025CFE043|nr:Slp family lipoprotein [uncultured Nitrosomonas sp.]